MFVVSSVTWLGNFLKFLATKFSYKSSPNNWWLFGLFWNYHFCSKNCCGYFLGNPRKNGLLFISTSDHTGGKHLPSEGEDTQVCSKQNISTFLARLALLVVVNSLRRIFEFCPSAPLAISTTASTMSTTTTTTTTTTTFGLARLGLQAWSSPLNFDQKFTN